jgi:hypothetical protein
MIRRSSQLKSNTLEQEKSGAEAEMAVIAARRIVR